jgi:hypothetical protein
MRYAPQACEDENAAISDEQRAARLAASTSFQDQMQARGVLVSSERLQPWQVTQSKAIASRPDNRARLRQPNLRKSST